MVGKGKELIMGSREGKRVSLSHRYLASWPINGHPWQKRTVFHHPLHNSLLPVPPLPHCQVPRLKHGHHLEFLAFPHSLHELCQHVLLIHTKKPQMGPSFCISTRWLPRITITLEPCYLSPFCWNCSLTGLSISLFTVAKGKHKRPWELLNYLPVWQSIGGSGQLLQGVSYPACFHSDRRRPVSRENTHLGC